MSSTSKKQSTVSRLGGGYGGKQHEQYPGEHGYEDSGDSGEKNIYPEKENKMNDPNHKGYRDRTIPGKNPDGTKDDD